MRRARGRETREGEGGGSRRVRDRIEKKIIRPRSGVSPAKKSRKPPIDQSTRAPRSRASSREAKRGKRVGRRTAAALTRKAAFATTMGFVARSAAVDFERSCACARSGNEAYREKASAKAVADFAREDAGGLARRARDATPRAMRPRARGRRGIAVASSRAVASSSRDRASRRERVSRSARVECERNRIGPKNTKTAATTTTSGDGRREKSAHPGGDLRDSGNVHDSGHLDGLSGFACGVVSARGMVIRAGRDRGRKKNLGRRNS